MIDKKRLLGISELKLAGKIEQMEDERVNEYEQLLILYIESFPENEQKIKAALGAKGYELLATYLASLCEMLERIYADDIAAECKKQIGVLLKDEEHTNHHKIETFVTGFLGAAASLSIDIQMAKYLEEKAEPKKTAEKEKDAEKEKMKKAESEPGKSARDKIILAVDDASISLSMLKKMLISEPYKLVCVNSGEDALRYLKTQKPDLFILDIEMPKMNGYELAEKIKASGQKAPIIFLTGNATRRYLMSAIKAGASDFIVKPVDKKYLTYKINKHI